MINLLKWGGALIFALLFSACGSSTPHLKLVVDPAQDTNDQLPCYVLVRAVDEKTFISEPYQSVADLVMNPDASVLQSLVIYPGHKIEIELTVPSKGRLAAYVLFTFPDGDWKTLIPTPTPGVVRLSLSSSRLIRNTTSSEGR